MSEVDVRFSDARITTAVNVEVSAEVQEVPPIRMPNGVRLTPTYVLLAWAWIDEVCPRGWDFCDARLACRSGYGDVELNYHRAPDGELLSSDGAPIPEWLPRFIEHGEEQLPQLKVSAAGTMTTAAVTVPTAPPDVIAYGQLPDWSTTVAR
ncbi:hypothetical protein ACFWY9_31330 [Amycolatopsis sp. NPDC059027]|uniref:hypothetical protein n=1 Tax=unclassified Amycolatopsis TaxID=2618356 RepID=UPI00366C8CA9